MHAPDWHNTRWQFGLRHVFACISIIAVTFGLERWSRGLGAMAAIYASAVFGFVRRKKWICLGRFSAFLVPALACGLTTAILGIIGEVIYAVLPEDPTFALWLGNGIAAAVFRTLLYAVYGFVYGGVLGATFAAATAIGSKLLRWLRRLSS